MDINLRRNQTDPTDGEIDRDVMELRQLLAGIDGPSEPHPAYWQNFVVRVRTRIDDGGGRRKGFSFPMAWASVGAAAVIGVVAVSGIFSPKSTVMERPVADVPALAQSKNAPTAEAPLYQERSSADPLGGDVAVQSLMLSGEDVQMLNAIMSNDDDAIFEALVNIDG